MIGIQESGNPPTDSGDPVLQMRMATAALAAEDRTNWTGPEKSERLQELLDIKERFDAEVLRLTGSWDRDRAWEIDGALSPRSWLTHRTPISEHEAQRLVKLARLVDTHHQISQALADGDITAPHVEAIGRVMAKHRAPLLDDHADTIVDQAKNLPVADFTTLMRRWASLADDQLGKDEFMQKWERRHLHASVGLDGWVTGDFYLDPVAGETLLSTLDHIAPPDPEDTPDGPRLLSQRRADALTDLSNWYTKDEKPGGNPPNINAVIDVASLLGETPQMAAARCDIDGVGPVIRSVLEQMCCDARLARFVTAGPSQVLDMGRAARTATSRQRRALAVRDRHCRFPGCHRQPRWCDAHHVAGWVESLGETNIDNLILL
ncbi:MAG: DUF222 domain-containing protein, partial [Acidimicrobiia bacterium]|nr:DUF222 domain-containing protein [Acidimicrobiia bacterium]